MSTKSTSGSHRGRADNASHPNSGHGSIQRQSNHGFRRTAELLRSLCFGVLRVPPLNSVKLGLSIRSSVKDASASHSRGESFVSPCMTFIIPDERAAATSPAGSVSGQSLSVRGRLWPAAARHGPGTRVVSHPSSIRILTWGERLHTAPCAHRLSPSIRPKSSRVARAPSGTPRRTVRGRCLFGRCGRLLEAVARAPPQR